MIHRHRKSLLRTMWASKKRRGVTSVLGAILLGLLLVCMAFAIDVGYFAVVRSQAQNCADAAALAGASAMLEDIRDRGTLPPTWASARDDAITFAALNPVGTTAAPTLLRNETNAETGALVLGRFNTAGQGLELTSPARYNAIRVTVKSTASLFFGGLITQRQPDISATAIAIFEDRMAGFKMTASSPPCSLLPLAVDRADWLSQCVHAGGLDHWKYNSSNGSVEAGSDQLCELDVQATLDIGRQGLNATALNRQIQSGPTATDLDPDGTHGGALTCDQDAGSLDLPGTLGLAAGLDETAALSLIGQSRTVFLIDSSRSTNTNFRIVGFAGVRVVQVDLQSSTKSIRVQPAYVFDDTLVPSTTPSENYFLYPPHPPVRLVR